MNQREQDELFVLADRLTMLCHHMPRCAACGDAQVQMVDYFHIPALWKCRGSASTGSRSSRTPNGTFELALRPSRGRVFRNTSPAAYLMLRDSHHGKPCPYCQRTMSSRDARLHPTRDHVIPRVRGGTVKIICCFTCNGIKGCMMPDEWRAYMAANPGWWLLTRAERRARNRAEARVYDFPNKNGNRIIGRQDTAQMRPVIVPPELIWQGSA